MRRSVVFCMYYLSFLVLFWALLWSVTERKKQSTTNPNVQKPKEGYERLFFLISVSCSNKNTRKLQEKRFKLIITIDSKKETVPLPHLPTEKYQYGVEKEALPPPYTHHHMGITIHAPQYIHQHTCITIHAPPCVHHTCIPYMNYHHHTYTHVCHPTCATTHAPPYMHHCMLPPCMYHHTCTSLIVPPNMHI